MSLNASRKGEAGTATYDRSRGNSVINLDDPRDKLVFDFANEIAKRVDPWIRAAVRLCDEDHLYAATEAVLKEFTDPWSDVPSIALIREYINQIAQALTQLWDSDRSPLSISIQLWDILQQNGALPSRHGLDQNPPDDPDSYSIAQLTRISITEMCLDLKERIYYGTGAVLQAIKDEILGNVDSSKDIDIVINVHGWDVVDFMKDQHENNRSLAEILVIVGTAKQAYVAPCWKYMRSIFDPNFDNFGVFIWPFAALEDALRNGKFSTMSGSNYRLCLY